LSDFLLLNSNEFVGKNTVDRSIYIIMIDRLYGFGQSNLNCPTTAHSASGFTLQPTAYFLRTS